MKPANIFLLPAVCFAASCGPQMSEEEKEAERLSAQREQSIKQMAAEGLNSGKWDLKLDVADIEMGSLGEKRETKLIERMEQRGTGEYCLRQQAAKSPSASFFAGGMEDCAFNNLENSDGKLSVRLTCSMGSIGSLEIDMAGPVTADSYSLSGDMAARLPVVGRVNMKGSITGAYTGSACASKE